MIVETGWYGEPGVVWSSKVHIAQNGKPVCGAQLRKGALFQWCSRGINIDYVECKHCIAWNRRRIESALRDRG